MSAMEASVEQSMAPFTLLFVDDEANILSSLRRLLRPLGYRIFIANGGAEGLAVLEKEHVDLVISDMRMPEMDGATFLAEVAKRWPETVRILLTGYSDLASIVGSINDGEVYRFISKPWNHQELQQTVAEAVTIALELADAKAAPVDLPQKMSAGVLVIDNDQEIYRFTRELIGGRCPVCYASNLDNALGAMQAQEIAVVLADVEAGSDDTTAMLKLLKQEYPQILTIVLTSASDSELVIHLINEAQIFRFLNKPVNVKLLKQHVEAALARYLAFQKTPQLLRQHRVQESREVRDSSVGQKILASLKLLRGRWFGAGKKP